MLLANNLTIHPEQRGVPTNVINNVFTMAALFSTKALITSDQDLKEYIKTLPKSFALIDNGMSIFPYTKLNLLPPEKIKPKMAIILNTLKTNELKNQIGHWTILLKFKKIVIFVDSLAQKLENSDLYIEIQNFCSQNKCKLFTCSLKTQTKSANTCGFAVIFFLNFFANNSLTKTVHLLKTLSSHSLPARENYILSKTYKLFKP